MTYAVTVNNVNIEIPQDVIEDIDLIENGANAYHLINSNQSYLINVNHSNFLKKRLTLSINGNNYDVHIADTLDQMVKEMGLLSTVIQKIKEICAPMPGLIIDIMVTEGQEVLKDTPLVVLSAMKMENVILSEGLGIVKSVKVKENDVVEKAQVIIEME